MVMPELPAQNMAWGSHLDTSPGLSAWEGYKQVGDIICTAPT